MTAADDTKPSLPSAPPGLDSLMYELAKLHRDHAVDIESAAYRRQSVAMQRRRVASYLRQACHLKIKVYGALLKHYREKWTDLELGPPGESD
jgi:hypothetical protein